MPNTPDQRSIQEQTTLDKALIDAAYQGKLDLVKELVEQQGANINSKLIHNNSAFISAVNYCQAEVIVYLHSKGADIKVKDRYQRNALMIAICNNLDSKANKETLQTLLTIGIDPLEQDRDGITALGYAIRRNARLAVDALLPHINVASLNQPDKDNKTYLMKALEEITSRRRLQLIPSLLNAGADCTFVDAEGRTLLMSILSKLNLLDHPLEFIMHLVSQGVSLTARDNQGKSVIHYAIEAKDLPEDILPYLLQAGAADWSREEQLIIEAVKNNNQKIFTALLHATGAINIQNDEGCTALMMACKNRGAKHRFLFYLACRLG